MSIGEIRLRCDTTGCYANCCTEAACTIEGARERAAERWDWSHTNGLDHCGPCTRGDADKSVAYYAGRSEP